MNTLSIYRRAQTIEGFSLEELNIDIVDFLEICQEVSNDWEDAEEIGSSDFTFMVKQAIDELLPKEYTTTFAPYLMVVKR